MLEPEHAPNNRRFLIPVLALLLFLAVVGAMAPLLSGRAEFIADDYYFIVNNPRVTQFSLQSFAEIWLKPMRLEYFPVTISSYAVEHALWGDNVKLYRMTNLLLFWGIGLAAWSLAVRMTASDQGDPADERRISVAAFLAMLVVLFHPVNVESAAAISHRKELLYVLFGLLAFRWYIAPSPTPRKTAGALVLMSLAQLSKGSGIVVPLLFVLYEMFDRSTARSLKQRFARLAPFVAVSAVIFAAQFLVAYRSGVVAAEPVSSLEVRLGGIVRTFSFMLQKFFVPVNLTYDYDLMWPKAFPVAELLLPSLLLAFLGYLAWKRRGRQLMAVLLALVTLAPYLQLVPLAHNLPGQIVFYDHYLLFSTVLLAVPLTGLLLSLTARRKELLAVPAIVACCWLAYDFYLAGFWQTRETLYTRLVATSPALPKGYLFLGRTYLETERYEEAKQTLAGVFRSKQWNPTFAEVYQALGDANAFSGNYPAAEKSYRTYLTYKPDDLKSLQNLSSTLIQMGRLPEAQEVLQTLLRYYPADPIGRSNLALVAQQQKAMP